MSLLHRSDSSVTVPDSCASFTPRSTPKKRPYTQVFSTPLGSSKRGLLTTFSRSPSGAHRVPLSSFIEPQTPTRCSRSAALENFVEQCSTDRTSGQHNGSEISRLERRSRYNEEFNVILSDKVLQSMLDVSLALAQEITRLEGYQSLLDLAWQDYLVTLRNPADAPTQTKNLEDQECEEDRAEMKLISVRYVLARHEVRVRRLIRSSRPPPLDSVSHQSCDQLRYHKDERPTARSLSSRVEHNDADTRLTEEPTLSAPVTSIPPTPPASSGSNHDIPSSPFARDHESSRLTELRGSQPPEMAQDSMPWPASGGSISSVFTDIVDTNHVDTSQRNGFKDNHDTVPSSELSSLDSSELSPDRINSERDRSVSTAHGTRENFPIQQPLAPERAGSNRTEPESNDQSRRRSKRLSRKS